MEDLISPDAVTVGLPASSKKQALKALAEAASAHTGLDARDLLDTLLERERLGSTAVGHGIAIPHGRIPGIDGLKGFLARLDKPVEFDAIDDVPVDLVFMLLAPESAGAEHLRTLARVSRALRDPATTQRLRQAVDASTMRAVLVAEGPSDAAA